MSMTPQQLIVWWRGIAADHRTYAARMRVNGDLYQLREATRTEQSAKHYELCATHLERVLKGDLPVPDAPDAF